ncbi:hypothetical protein ABZV77_28315 [Streptomyces sp. NPDC004732]|uniref:hypothetical protein n=1 Tax=Streptomyces sp. NPDC004732 TaxID=3154290 RepID=UPI0033A6D2BC
MEHNPGADWLTEAAKAAQQQGPGNLLRIVLIVMVVGCVLVGWFLLRGYRQGSGTGAGTGTGPGTGSDKSTDEGADKSVDEGADNRNG